MRWFTFLSWLGMACLVSNVVTLFYSNQGEPFWSVGKKLFLYTLDVLALNVGRNRNDPNV